MSQPENSVRIVDGGLMTVREAAAFLGISVAALYVLMGRGEIIYAKIGRSRRIPRNALVEYAASKIVTRGE